MNSTPFQIVPLTWEFVQRIRRTLRDDFGHALEVTRLKDRVPCRYSLELIEPGEELILLSYSPFTGDHPYREVGPIFVRATGYVAYSSTDQVPPQLDSTKRVFRGYNSREEIVDARVGSTDSTGLITDLFSNPAVECIHARSLTHGCFTFKITRR